MGIEGLPKFLRQQGLAEEAQLEDFAGDVFAVDASNPLTAMLKLGMDLVSGTLMYARKLVEAGIVPVFIFDGETRDAKQGEHARRRKRKRDAEEALVKARKRLKTGEYDLYTATQTIDKLERTLAPLTPAHVNECKRVLTAMGIPWMQAPDEADTLCAALYHTKRIVGCISNDSDFLARGIGVLLTQVTCGGTSRRTVVYKLKPALEHFGMTQAEFIDLCILMGCDYTGHIAQIGPKRALQFMQKHKSIECILAEVCDKEKTRYTRPSKETFDYERARYELRRWNEVRTASCRTWLQPYSPRALRKALTDATLKPTRCKALCDDWIATRQKIKQVNPRCTLVGHTGDLFSDTQHALVHCVSQDLHMGAGIAVQFKKRFGRVDCLRTQRPTVGRCLFLLHQQRFIFYLVTKTRYFDKPTYTSLRYALEDLRIRCETYKINVLSLPRIGCGLDKLQWSRVRELIVAVFRTLPITLHIYTLPTCTV